jgi:Barstar (barnase inhibitor)
MPRVRTFSAAHQNASIGRVLHTSIMVADGETLPVLVVDEANFSDIDGFAREFSRLLCHYTWHGNLDAFNDILRGGFGTPEDGWALRWLNSELSRAALGQDATIRWLEQILLTCHPSNRANVRTRISDARRGAGPTPPSSAKSSRSFATMASVTRSVRTAPCSS